MFRKLFLAIGLISLLLAGALVSPFRVGREVVNEAGQVVLGADGEPLIEFSYWANFFAHWRENLAFLVSGLFALATAVLVARLIFRRISRRASDVT